MSAHTSSGEALNENSGNSPSSDVPSDALIHESDAAANDVSKAAAGEASGRESAAGETSARESDAGEASGREFASGETSAAASKAWLKYYPAWTPHSIDYGTSTLLDIYEQNLAKNSHLNATYFFGRTETFRELDSHVQAAAAGLRRLGVGSGDRVAIVAPNCPQHVAAFYAILMLGATVVEHNPLYTAHELEGLFQDHEARVAIVWDKAVETVSTLMNSTPLEAIVSINLIEAMPRIQQIALKLPPLKAKREQLSNGHTGTLTWKELCSHSAPQRKASNGVAASEDGTYSNVAEGGAPSSTAASGDGAPSSTAAPVGGAHSNQRPNKDSIALIMYTSGTTGKPKGAQLSHGNLVANIMQGKAWVPGLGDNPEKMLAALPFFHAYGLTMNLTLSQLIGGELVLLPAPQVPLIMQLMKKRTPTWVPGVPTLYERIVDSAKAENTNIAGVRAAFSGASTLPVSAVQEWEEYTGGLLVEGYGLTECSPIIVGNPMTQDRRPGYVGIPFPDTEIRIANPDNLDETVPDGTEGEVLARGPQIFHGYLNNPEATAAAFHNDWFRTGDLGVMEPDGFIRLVSRIKEIIITGGFNVYPAEVEDVIRSHPDVDDVAVVGRPREDGSEDVVACIDLADGAALDPEGLKEYCRERLTRYKVPRTFYHFESLAKDQMGKIRRREVQADLLRRLAREA